VSEPTDGLGAWMDDGPADTRQYRLLEPILPDTGWTLQPGDHLIVRIPTHTTVGQAAHVKDTLTERCPGLTVTVVAAEEWLVYRPDLTGYDYDTTRALLDNR
jgi:hypothetical protein